MNGSAATPHRTRSKLHKSELIFNGMAALLLCALLLVLLVIFSAPYIEPYLTPVLARHVNSTVKITLALFSFLLLAFLLLMVRFTYVKYGLAALVIAVSGTHYCGAIGWRGKIGEGINLSNPHRTAIGIDCSETTMLPRSVGESHQHLALSPPVSYVGTYIQSVSAETKNMSQGQVTITFSKTIVDESSWPIRIVVARPGDVLVYQGTCAPNGMTWKIKGSIPEPYLRRFE